MKYDFTIQPNPVKIQGVEAENDIEAQRKVQDMLDNQTESIMAALRQSRWVMTLVHTSETYISTPHDVGLKTPSRLDPGVESTVQSEARTDDVLEQDLFA